MVLKNPKLKYRYSDDERTGSSNEAMKQQTRAAVRANVRKYPEQSPTVTQLPVGKAS